MVRKKPILAPSSLSELGWAGFRDAPSEVSWFPSSPHPRTEPKRAEGSRLEAQAMQHEE